MWGVATAARVLSRSCLPALRGSAAPLLLLTHTYRVSYFAYRAPDRLLCRHVASITSGVARACAAMLPSQSSRIDLTLDDSDDVDAAAAEDSQARALEGGAQSKKRSRKEERSETGWHCCGILNDILASECALCDSRRPDRTSLPSPAEATSLQPLQSISSRPAQADADDGGCRIVGLSIAHNAAAMTRAGTSAEQICISSGIAQRHEV